MDTTVAAGVLEAIAASALRLAGVLRGAAVNPAEGLATGSLAAGPSTACPADVPSKTGPATGSDLLHWQADACLTVLTGTGGMEAMFAAVKVHGVNGYDEAAQAIAGAAASPPEHTARDMGSAEVACADRQRTHCRGAARSKPTLTTALPLTLAAL